MNDEATITMDFDSFERDFISRQKVKEVLYKWIRDDWLLRSSILKELWIE